MDILNKKIVVTGGSGFLGSVVVRKLIERGVPEANILVPRSKDFDLRTMDGALKATSNQDIVIHLAANVGGIGYNRKYPGRAFYDNASMALNLIEASRENGVEKFVGIGSVCEYPKDAPVPFREGDLWLGYPEETNAPYGLAKKMMLTQTQAYNQEYDFSGIHLLMVNLYGPGDDFHPETSHVIPALIKKVHDAKVKGEDHIDAWGTGSATREFLYIDDAAEAIVLATERYDSPEPVNIGSGMEISIKDLVELIVRLMDYKGEIRWDSSKPDGQPRRSLDVSKAKKEFGFEGEIGFEKGLENTIDWYLEDQHA